MQNLYEIVDPIRDFYSMRHKNRKETMAYIFLPLIVGALFLVCDGMLITKRIFLLDDFILDLINQLITLLVLFISFSMAYLSMIITSSSRNIDNLKGTPSNKYRLKGSRDFCTLYQVIVCEITYMLVIDIFFLLLTLFEKFIVYLLNDFGIKIIITVNIILLIHTLLIMLISIKDIYYSFWKSK